MSYHRRESMGFLTEAYNAALSTLSPDQQRAALERECPSSETYKSMVRQADGLDATWNPTGTYTWQEMAEVIAATIKVAGQASSAAIQFFSGTSTPSAKDAVRRAQQKYNDIAKQALDYTEAWKAAKAAGKPVVAPGFKKWVVDDLRAAAELFRELEIQNCRKPWWVGSVVAFSSAFVAAVDVARRVTGVVLKIGEAAVKAVERTGGIVAFLLSIAPYAGLGVGGYFAYKAIKRRVP